MSANRAARRAYLKSRRDTADQCFYCRCRLTHNIPPVLDTDATIEHLNSRTEFPEGRPNEPNTIVIACRKCNEDRARSEEVGLGIDRLRALAGRWPREYEARNRDDLCIECGATLGVCGHSRDGQEGSK